MNKRNLLTEHEGLTLAVKEASCVSEVVHSEVVHSEVVHSEVVHSEVVHSEVTWSTD